jgi:hypothetical protein
MKTIVKNNETKVNGLTVIQSATNGGKKCVALLTEKRLSIEDFKSLMNDIRTAEGFGFMKYNDEHKLRLVTATGIEADLFLALCGQYNWSEKVVKTATKKTPAKASNTKTDKAEKTAIADMKLSSEEAAMFAKFNAFIKAGGKIAE